MTAWRDYVFTQTCFSTEEIDKTLKKDGNENIIVMRWARILSMCDNWKKYAMSTSWKNQIAFKIRLRLREARRFVIHFSWWIKEKPSQYLFVSLSCSVRGSPSHSKTGPTFKACLAHTYAKPKRACPHFPSGLERWVAACRRLFDTGGLPKDKLATNW